MSENNELAGRVDRHPATTHAKNKNQPSHTPTTTRCAAPETTTMNTDIAMAANDKK
jgi:hypothetical protein